MEVYGGIDLHGNNIVVVLIDAGGKVVYRKRLVNEWPRIERALEPYRTVVKGVVVESTFNWYWLVDALQDAQYRVHLAHPTAIKPYSGLEHGDDDSDARWLAELLRLGILPEGTAWGARPAAQVQPVGAPSHGAHSEHPELGATLYRGGGSAARRSSTGPSKRWRSWWGRTM